MIVAWHGRRVALTAKTKTGRLDRYCVVALSMQRRSVGGGDDDDAALQTRVTVCDLCRWHLMHGGLVTVLYMRKY
jgi:hypothetical protein